MPSSTQTAQQRARASSSPPTQLIANFSTRAHRLRDARARGHGAREGRATAATSGGGGALDPLLLALLLSALQQPARWTHDALLQRRF